IKLTLYATPEEAQQTTSFFGFLENFKCTATFVVKLSTHSNHRGLIHVVVEKEDGSNHISLKLHTSYIGHIKQPHYNPHRLLSRNISIQSISYRKSTRLDY